MINVIASIGVREGKRAELLEIFNANVPAVRAEQGCIEYYPTVDLEADFDYPPQDKDPNVVTVIEKWETLAALRAHTKAAHMLSYREKVKDLVTGVSVKVLEQG
jgi:quinol monooxygenase YgiN